MKFIKNNRIRFRQFSLAISCLSTVLLLLCSAPAFAQYKTNYFNQGKQELIKGNYTKAIEYFGYVIDENNFDEAYFFRAHCKEKLGDVRGAIIDYTKCIRISPYHKEAYHYRALARNQLNDYQGAFQDFTFSISLDSSNWRVFFNRSLTFLDLKDFKKAIKDCNKALELNPSIGQIYVARGIAKTGLKEFENAILDYNKAIATDESNLFAWIKRGSCYSDMKLYEKALNNFDWVINHDSSNVDAIYARGLMYKQMGEIDLALKDLDQVILLSPGFTVAIFNRAIIRSDRGEYEAALSDYDNILARSKNNILALFNRAVLKQKTNDLKGAVEDYTIAINLHPEFTDAYYNRSALLSRLNNYEAAKSDKLMAEAIGRAQDARSDQAKQQEYFKVKKLRSLSGPQPDTSKNKGLVQYNYVDVEIKPFYLLAPSDNYKGKHELYDAYSKNNYSWNLIGLVPSTYIASKEQTQKELNTLESIPENEKASAGFLVKRAIIYTYLEKYNEAFADFNQAIKLDPKNILGYFGRANARLKYRELLTEFESTGNFGATNTSSNSQNIYTSIIDDYNKAIYLDPTFTYAYFNRSYLKSLSGDFTESISDLTTVLHLKPEFPEAYFNRGLTNLYLGNNLIGCAELSSAGELGLNEVYNIILRYCTQ
ncbi:MAG: tetratricopeptide repeat protein [Flavobacteriales bacterium]|nr:tetratricopeptide repeat protein [Flavobacteriales bacterium]